MYATDLEDNVIAPQVLGLLIPRSSDGMQLIFISAQVCLPLPCGKITAVCTRIYVFCLYSFAMSNSNSSGHNL